MAKKKTEELKPSLDPPSVEKAVELQDEELLLEKPKEGLATELGEVKELEEVIVEEVKKKGAF